MTSSRSSRADRSTANSRANTRANSRASANTSANANATTSTSTTASGDADARASRWQVAFLRGVNVSTGNRVPMSELTAIVEACGFTRVRTLLNSGNVVYQAARVSPATAASRIRAGLADRVGVDTPVLVRTREMLAQVLRENPLADEAAAHPSRFLVMLFDEGHAERARTLIEATPFTIERAAVGEHAAYFSLPDGISASAPFEVLGRKLGTGVTSRNWNTMTKLLELMAHD